MRIEEEYEDVLENLEFVVAAFYRLNPEMTDYEALRTYESLMRSYGDEALGREARPCDEANLSELEAELLRAVRAMCEWRLGRGESPAEEEEEEKINPIDAATMVLCLKRLAKSVQGWTKRGGRRGYLDFVSEFV